METLCACPRIEYSKIRSHSDAVPFIKQNKGLFISVGNPQHIVLIRYYFFRLGPYPFAAFRIELRKFRVKIRRRNLYSLPSLYVSVNVHNKRINQTFPCRVKHCEHICQRFLINTLQSSTNSLKLQISNLQKIAGVTVLGKTLYFCKVCFC